MAENETTSDQDDVSFIRTDDMVCLQCSETGERVCLAAEGFGNRHCFLEPIANENFPPEMPSCVFVIEQALSVRALQEMVTAESSDIRQSGASETQNGPGGEQEGDGVDETSGADGPSGSQLSAMQLTSRGQQSGGAGAADSGVGGGNRTLLYGHAVLLRHLHSGMYLATLPICSSSDKLAFDVGLKDTRELGESCWWTVHPGSKQRSEGEKVRVGDDLILVSVATERYLHYTITTDMTLVPPMASASAEAVMSNAKLTGHKQAIVNASFHSTHWSIAPFGTGLSRVKNVGYVFGGQVLRLLHGGDECLTVPPQQSSVTSGGDQQVAQQQQQQQQQQQHQDDGGAAAAAAQLAATTSTTATSSVTKQAEVIYEGGAVMSQARSLWRLDFIRTRWSGGFVQYSNALRIRHITTGKYLGVKDDGQTLSLLSKVEANVRQTAFCLRLSKDDGKGNKTGDGGDEKDEEVIGRPMIKYGDSSFFIQHMDSGHWLSYKSYETKKRGIGRVEEKQAILSEEGKMDDCLEFSRSQEEEAKTARVIRKCDALFSKFIKILDHVQQLAALQKSNEFGDEFLDGLTGGADVNQEGRFVGSGSGEQPRYSAKKRGSVATSAVAVAALSGLAPLFPSTLESDSSRKSSMQQATSGGAQDQQQQQQSGSQSPGGTRRFDSLFSSPTSLFPFTSQVEMSKCLEDLIDYFAPPEEGCDHEQEQNRLRALRNRQDLFQEEGILNLILDAIDKINLISGQGLLVLLLGEESSSTWEAITGYFYQLLAAIIKDNHTNCAQFAQSHRLNWLFSRLSSQQASEGTGMLDVLHCVLVDSPEALNMLKESHIKVLISLLEKHGRDPKVLNVLCSLCVSNGVAIRSSQNTITNHLLPGRNLLLQTRLVDHVASMKPNIYVARVDGSAMYPRWYYEVVVDHIELINNLCPHLRVGWANTKGYLPYPGGGSYWGANGVGDDFYSYGFDGQYLWTAGRPVLVRIPPTSTMTRQEVMQNQLIDYGNQQQSMLENYANQQTEFVASSSAPVDPASGQNAAGGGAAAATSDGLTSIANIDPFTHSPYLRLQKGDVIGCFIDLSVPTIQFTINGKQIFGFFKNFNVTNGGFFHPVISFSAKVSCRFLFGGNQGELRYRPPAGFSPIVEVLLPNQEVSVEPCFSFGDLAKQTVAGPQTTPDSSLQTVADLIYIPKVIETQNIELSNHLESLRDSLAENMHELWCMSRIEDGWIFGDDHDDQNQTHPFIAPFGMLPPLGKKYKLDLASQTLKIIFGLGYKITPPPSNQDGRSKSGQQATGQRVKTYKLPNMPYLQPNGYKPAPLDLSNAELTPQMNQLAELLAENIHNIWAAEKISLRWTYRRRDPMNELGDDYNDSRSCHLLPYKYVDDEIKLKNRQSALETVFTISAYGYHIEPASPMDRMSMDPMTPMVSDSDLLSPSLTPGGARSPISRPVSVASGIISGAGSTSSSEPPLTGYEVILNNALEVGLRHYRAEKTYAVSTGRWYYEVEIYSPINSASSLVGSSALANNPNHQQQQQQLHKSNQKVGHIQIGWANLSFQSSSMSLGCDENGWAFDCHLGRKVHASNHESFGQVAQEHDVIGCMLDLNDRTISYSLNGKLMLDYLGNEMAFGSHELPNDPMGYVPAITLGVDQRVRLCFGQDVEQLRYFTDYGLQEGYHPFCVNMHKPITLWYNKREPNFVNLDDLNSNEVNIDVIRIPPGSDSPPALKICYKSFESQERASWEYLRLSLPVTINSELIDETDKIAKMQEIQAQQLRIAYSKAREYGKNSRAGLRGAMDGSEPLTGGRHPARLEQHMLQSGFSIADVKDLQRSYESPHDQHHHDSGHSSGGYLSGLNLTSRSQQQRRQQLVKTRSVDDKNQQAAPSLAVPSFSEAQRMMSAEKPTKSSLLKRRNTGFTGLLRGSSTSLENINAQGQTNQQQQQQQQQQQGQLGGTKRQRFQQTDRAADLADLGVKTTRSKSTFKSLFGSMKGAKAPSAEGRSQSLSRQLDPNSQLSVPKISIQNDNHFGQQHHGHTLHLPGQRSRSMSRSGSYQSLLSALGSSEQQDSQQTQEAPQATGGRGLVRRLSRVGLGGGGGGSGSSQKSQPPARQAATSGQTVGASSGRSSPELGAGYDGSQFDLQQLDPATLDLIDEYYYGVRIFPGQEPSHVLCGWVTSLYKHENLNTLQDIQHTQIVQSVSLLTGQTEVCERRECYLLNAGQLYKEMHPVASQTATSGGATSPTSGSGANQQQQQQQTAESGTRSNRGMLIGCHVDTSTGVLFFTVDGKMTKYKVQLEPQTKLYPGIFFQATTGDCLQFELSRTPLTLPLSAAILNLTSKHVNPQCPPRLKVQTMQPCTWSRVPNVSLRPNSLKLSESRGWSMLADDPLVMLVVHIPEENRCLDVLELIEHERLLKFHSYTLILYGALCAQGNHKVAHIICSYVDQRQLLYAINSDYLSGDLRRGFADLLIALHLEFHAYGRHLTQNEFIVPISRQLCQLYGELGDGQMSPLVHSFSRIECVSIRTEMNMSPIGFDLNSIDSTTATSGANFVKLLSTPYFPIRVLKKLVFKALDEAVFKGNLPIRDLPGGSNENLFVPLLKLADKLLLIGCITNQELGRLLSLVDPETFERPNVEQGVSLDSQQGLAGLSFLALGANSPSSVWKPTILEQPALSLNSNQINSRHLNSKGLLQMRKLDEHVKLIICHILHHLLDIQLRHRIESIMAFSVNFVGQLQTDQRRRYDEIKTSNLPSHLTARKTREFRCTPKEQMRYILNFKSNTDTDDLNASPSSETLRQMLKSLHSSMMKQIKVIIESSGDDGSDSSGQGLRSDEYYARQRLQDSDFYGAQTSDGGERQSAILSSMQKLLRVLKLVKSTLLSQHPRIDSHLRNQNGQFASLLGYSGQTELKFIKAIVKTIVKWAEESTIENKLLVRQMFHLLLRCYNGVGELIEALNNSYVIGEKSKQDVIDLLQVLSKVRALLAVQMGPAEEEVMRDCLWTLVNNVVFFQHPDLIRILRVHENVMHVMMNTLSKRSRAAQSGSGAASASAALAAAASGQQVDGQTASQQQMSARQRTQSIPGLQPSQAAASAASVAAGQQAAGSSAIQDQGASQDEQEDDISKMVVSCCRFLCFFCRSSAKNQKAMFEHLGFLLENSNILLSRPSLRGSTPLDVAYSSLMENHELVLALRESYLEKIAIYLSRCGLQSNQELTDKGYPDVGWDPVEGERYLDFLRFCVWVNGESVEENSNLVIRLLIRRPECLGPALRGEGPGLFAAIKDAIAMADKIHASQQEAKRRIQLENLASGNVDEQTMEPEEEDEDQINMGSAILNFYCALVDLLGRCAPDLLTIGQGKHESIRARSILKSLVPLQDLRQAISLRFSLVSPQCSIVNDSELPFASTASSFMPNHKQSLVLFLERVYGIEDQETFFSLLEEAFLPDMRAATMLERCLPAGGGVGAGSSPEFGQQTMNDSFSGINLATGGAAAGNDQSDNDESPENEMTLALNRYLGNSAIPLLIRESHYFKNAENYANLLEPTLHTVYRLSKVKILTKGQRESVSDFLIALTREMQPHQLLKLLRKLTVDVAVLNESTTVALRLLTLHYERCSKYYGSSGNSQPSTSGVYVSEEERRLTMVLFTNIFDSLSLMDYDPELFENALPCLNALACALSPDYSLTESREFSPASQRSKKQDQNHQAAQSAASQSVGPYTPQPVDTHQVELSQDLRQLALGFSEHYHDAWASRKLDRDWSYGEQYSFKNKTHPRLKPYALLTQFERDRYIEPIEEAMKALIAMGWTIDRMEQHQQSSAQQQQQQQQQAAGNGLSRSPSRLTSDSLAYASNSRLDPNQQHEMIANYNPQPIDTSNLSLSRELQNLAERSAENAHDLWARKQMEDWDLKLRATSGDFLRAPIMLHPMMVPYDLLTDKEKRKNRDRSQELLKYMLFEGYKVFRLDELDLPSPQQVANARGRINSRAGTDSNYNIDISRGSSSASSKRRFAYSILDKLIAYADTVMVKLELLKPSSNFSRRSSFKQSDRDVKFFSKVVLPLIERYFTAHREFFQTYYGLSSPTGGQSGSSASSQTASAAGGQTSVSGKPNGSPTGPDGLDDMSVVGSGGGVAGGAGDQDFGSPTGQAASTGAAAGVGCATIKEKEMLATLFCKLASVLRNKLSVIGPDAKIFVRCLQVLTRALDARSLSEQSPDFIKTSMLTYFNKTAQDLSQCVFNLQMKRYNAVRGTTMRISSSLYHVHLAVLPTLTALFDHLASSESGKYLLMDEIQIACQKILSSLYILGTRIQLAGNHCYSRKELERHRHSYGNCLAAFAAAFPIAFLEPNLLRFNRYSCMYTRKNQTLAGKFLQTPGGRSRTSTMTSGMQQPSQQAHHSLQVSSTSGGQGGQDQQGPPAPPSPGAQAAQSIDLPTLPTLEELIALVSKYVVTGKGITMPTNGASHGWGSGIQVVQTQRLDGSSSSTGGSLQAGGGGGGLAASSQLQGGGMMAQVAQVGQVAQVASSLSQPVGGGGGGGGGGGSGGNSRNRSAFFGGANAAAQRMIPADNEIAIIEVIVPLLCSYLPFWYSQGPEATPAARSLGAGNGSTNVASKHLNNLLRDIINLIKKQVGMDDSSGFNWMVAIAAHASQIIIESPETNLLAESFLPLSTKIAQRAEQIYHREEVMRGYLKSAAEDTTAIEEKIQEEFHVLVRDIYAFYPLLIKYVDYKKSTWLSKQRFNTQLPSIVASATGAGGDSMSGTGATLLATKEANSRLMSASDSPDMSQQQLMEEEQNKPEQLLFHQVATVFDIWSNSQYFRREEQNFISQHEIDNMALIMQASNRPGRIFFQKSDPTQSSSAGRKKNKRRMGEKRDREREVASSLLVVALKRLLPIGMNLFEGRERELVQHVKERFLKKEPQSRIEEVVRLHLTQPYQIDPSDEFCWQHYLYSRLGAQPALANGHNRANGDPAHDINGLAQSNLSDRRMAMQLKSRSLMHESMAAMEQQQQQQQSFVVDNKIISRIVDMARVFYGLHIIDHPNLQQQTGRRSCVSTQRRRVVIACFRMTSLHSLPKHRAINIFLRSYCDTWLLEENFGQEKLIEDLTQTFEQAEMKVNGDESTIPKNDPLSQLLMTLSRQATTEHGAGGGSGSGSMMMMMLDNTQDANGVDRLYLQFADIFRMSCGGDEEDDDEDGDNGGDEDSSGGSNGDDESADSGNGSSNEELEGVGGSGVEIREVTENGEEGDDSESGNKSDQNAASSIHEQEIEKQRLLFQQSRLSDRGVAEMILLYISAFSRYSSGSSSGASSSAGGASGSGSSGAGLSQQHTPMILSTLKLGISILRGGNVEVQRRMLKHLKDKKDVGFFTSIQLLMNSCSVLDLDAFERNQKAEALGVRSEGPASEKNMYDAEFTCKLFRFFQLLCEGHNLEFQNYLRTQAGNTTTVNVVISTVDYLLRLQESIMDFYWHYSSKEVIDPSGTENFIKAITIAKQVFCTLTESIQGPCPQNQQALAHSRLWHAVGGFLFLFAHMQDKLSRNSSQLNLLIELLDLQKEMVIMMLSMLEGNVVNGTIGKQMVETLVESSANVEIILKFFDMFLKLPRLTSSTNFQEYDKTGSGWISQADLRKAMEQHKIYTPEETQYLLSCCEPNHDGMIDYREFIDRFHQPAKDIGFNLAVLLTNLAEHITNEPRLQRFLETASTVLNYFEPYLGRIEIMGSAGRIERVYFEIKESTIDQWAKPQIQESKRAFFYSIVTEGDGKEKLEAFVNFCEDTIFEMQHASNILGEDEEEPPTKADKYPGIDAAASTSGGDASSSQETHDYMLGGGGGAGSDAKTGRFAWLRLIYDGLLYIFSLSMLLFNHLRPSRMRRRWLLLKRMTYGQIFVASIRMSINLWLETFKLGFNGIFAVLKFIFRIMIDDSSLTKLQKQPEAVTSSQQLSRKRLVPYELPSASQPVASTSTSIGRNSIAAATQEVGSASVAGQQVASTSSAIRTERLMAPSMMTASIADVTSGQTVKSAGSDTASQLGVAATPITTRTSIATKLPDLTIDTQQVGSLIPDENIEENFALEVDALLVPTATTKSKSRGLGFKLSQLTNYNQKIISFLARNFYTIKLLALVMAFIMNFILLFFKVSIWTGEISEMMMPTPSLSGALSGPLIGNSDSDNGDDELNELGNNNNKLNELEARVARGLTNYTNRYGRVNVDAGEADDDDDDEEDLEDEDEVGTVSEEEEENGENEAETSGDSEDKETGEDGDENGEEKEGDNDDDNDDDDENTDLVEFVVMEEKYYYLQTILTILASVHSLFSLCMLIAYYHLKVPLVIFKREKEIARKLEFDGVYITEEPDGENWWNGYWDKLVISAKSFPVNYWDKFVKKRVREKYREQYDYEALTNLLGMDKNLASGTGGGAGDSASSVKRICNLILGNKLSSLIKLDWRYQLWKAGVTLTDQSFQYQLLYLIFSLAGHFNYFFYAAHLLDVAVCFKNLRTILQSVTHNGRQLVLTVMLLTIIVYIYTVIAFNFFRKFYVQGDDSPDQKCHSMMTCFVYHLYQGVRAGGGIGDVIDAPDGDDYEVWRIIFDITFFFFVIVILLAIIQGLIIDAFGELRDQLLTVASDMESNCFICGIGKDVLDKVPRGFDTHVQKEHNLANYMFFLMHLINKPDTDYTGQETYVWELYQRRCWDFFPVGECFRTQSEEEADAKPAKD